jgi:hypothetical protein
MLRSFPRAPEHLLAAEHAAASAIAADRIASAAAAMRQAVPPLPPLQMPALLSAPLPSLAAAQEQLAALLRTWTRNLEGRSAFLRDRARRALLAARRARQALERNDLRPVELLLVNWLNLKAEPAVVVAAVEVLLEPGWDAAWSGDDPAGDDRPVESLRTRVQAVASRDRLADQPVWEHRVARQRVGLLGQPIPGLRGDGITLGDVIADKPHPDDASWFLDPRLSTLWRRMGEQDRAVAFFLGVSGGTWADAAVAAGYPAAAGEAVRRRLRRYAAELERRRAARG